MFKTIRSSRIHISTRLGARAFGQFVCEKLLPGWKFGGPIGGISTQWTVNPE